jgi:hypothetical protein
VPSCADALRVEWTASRGERAIHRRPDDICEHRQWIARDRPRPEGPAAREFFPIPVAIAQLAVQADPLLGLRNCFN